MITYPAFAHSFTMPVDGPKDVPEWMRDHCYVATRERWDSMLADLQHIAAISHDGGLLQLSEHDALVLVRKLSLQHYLRDGGRSESSSRLAAAIDAAKGA